MSKHEYKCIVTSRRTCQQNKNTVLVLGGYGFVGRHTVKALNKQKVNVLIGTRGRAGKPERSTERRISLHRALSVKDWAVALKGVDAVINTVSILRERRGESYDAVHHRGAAALAQACRLADVTLVHMSALGIEGQSRNTYSQSKLQGEQAIIDSGCRGAIVRTSVVNAPDGYGSGWLYRVARWPVWLVPAGAVHLLSPVDADDVGEALTALALHRGSVDTMGVVELGCDESFTLPAYLMRLRQHVNPRLSKPLLTIKVPQVIARFFAHVFDLLHITPYSIGHHELLEFDNVPVDNQLALILGRAPTSIGGHVDFPERFSAVSVRA